LYLSLSSFLWFAIQTAGFCGVGDFHQINNFGSDASLAHGKFNLNNSAGEGQVARIVPSLSISALPV
jgi:hypothetical protein